MKESNKALENISKRLEEVKERNLYRTLNYIEGPQDKRITLEGKELLLLASNNYLGLANNIELKEAAIKAINKYGFGSGGSRLTTGTYEINRILEKKLARFFNREEALVFNSGYAANTGIISAICDNSYAIFSDELNHASIIDGCRLTKAEKIIFKHNDLSDLKDKLSKCSKENKLIITEGIFSMGGNISKVEELKEIAKEFGAMLMVDDAHGIGVVGERGKGVLENYGINEGVHLYVGTLSKAIGSEGGFVVGNSFLIEFLKNKVRPFIFSTSISMASIAASIKALEIMERDNNLVESLQSNIRYINEGLKEIGIESNAVGAIIPILIGDEGKATKVSTYLREQGIFVSAIRYPTVKMGEAILRVCLMATHNKKDIDFFLSKLEEALNTF